MKKLIVLGLIFTLALGMVLVPSLAGGVCYDLEIIKVAYGPAEDFTFEAWRDINNNGEIDAGGVYKGEVAITGNGTGVICVDLKGPYVVHEVLIAGSVYEQPPDQVTDVPQHIPVIFENGIGGLEVGEILILKQDPDGNLITVAGASFNITPNPKTCEPLSVLTVVDEGLNVLGSQEAARHEDQVVVAQATQNAGRELLAHEPIEAFDAQYLAQVATVGTFALIAPQEYRCPHRLQDPGHLTGPPVSAGTERGDRQRHAALLDGLRR